MPFYYLQKFRAGTRRLTSIATESYEYKVSATVIAGAGGTSNQFGGGGAGGLLEVTNEPLITNQVYTIQVGGGGAALSSSPGTNSYFHATSIAQGGGSGMQSGNANGGSGGGNGSGSQTVPPIGTATQGNTTYGIGYGNNGGYGLNNTGGGAGGAGGAGGNGNTTNNATGPGGNGGSSRASDIDGTQYCGGGGGGKNGNFSVGTSGGGGAGNGGGGNNGASNSGSGGGGSSEQAPHGGSAGGSGVVILKMPSGQYSGITTGTPAVDTTTAAGFVILKYTGNGTYTA